jgi:hypothetical protein
MLCLTARFVLALGLLLVLSAEKCRADLYLVLSRSGGSGGGVDKDIFHPDDVFQIQFGEFTPQGRLCYGKAS